MKKFKILVGFIGLVAVFSFTNVVAQEATQNKEAVAGVSANVGNVFTLNQFRDMYEILKKDGNFNSKFLVDMEGIFKNSVLPYIDQDVGTWRILDKNSSTFEQELLKLRINDMSRIDGKGVFYCDRPTFLSNGFEERLRGLNLPNYIFLTFKQMNEAERVHCLEGLQEKVSNNETYCTVDKDSNLCILTSQSNLFNFSSGKDDIDGYNNNYIIILANELKKLNLNYSFRFENSKFVCCYDSEEGRDLAKLVNFYLYLLNLVEFHGKNFDSVIEWLKSRGGDWALGGRF